MNSTLKYRNLLIVGLILSLTILGGCGLLDPTNVVNPNTTEEDLEAGAAGATGPFLNGALRNLTFSVRDEGLVHDTISDNYDNISTNLGDVLDTPDLFLPRDSRGYTNHQALRATADYVITTVAPNDPEATDDQFAEAYFVRGMANLLSAESYWAVPMGEDLPASTMQERLNLALGDFTAAMGYNSDGDFTTRIHILKARTYRLLGDKTNAIAEANLAVSGSQDFVFNAEFDASSTTNSLYFYAVSRSLNDLQPLPRLEFLDPKYHDRDAPMAIAKMEEAYLILAEAYIANGDFDNAKTALSNAVTVADDRPTSTLNDNDPRTRTDGNYIPQTGAVTVKASATSPEVTGLVFTRSGAAVDIPTISGTSLDAADILALPSVTTDDKVELLRLVYLTRQEIFFAEGRRMTDLGIRLPISEVEQEQNTSITKDVGIGTAVYVPSFVPALDGMDDYTVSGNVITIDYDMNFVLASNRSAEIKPNSADVATTLCFAPYGF